MTLGSGAPGRSQRRWVQLAAAATATGLKPGLATGLAAAIPFGAIAAVAAGLGLCTPGSAFLATLALLVAVASVTTVIVSRTRVLRREIQGLHSEVLSIGTVASLGGGYPLPFGIGRPMTPDALGELARTISERRPDVIVELGSGLSSLVMGLTVKRLGHGRVVTYDHDEGWAKQTERHIAPLGLSDVVKVVHAPLADMDVNGVRRTWYDLGDTLPDQPIDLLVVDGPPAFLDDEGIVRWPALPLLEKHLSDRAVVFVDDANRKGERRMVERWLAGDPRWRARRIPTVSGVAILERVPGS